MATFFTSDTHFGHANIIRYCKRPYPTASEMDEAMIANWNAVVRPDDDVWHCGDFAWHRGGKLEQVFWRLNGRKHLVIGNHDEENADVLALPWADPPAHMRLITVEGQRVFLCHYPMMSWPKIGKGAWHLHGHMHGRMPGTRLYADAGVDSWNYRPVGMADIRRRLRQSPEMPTLAGDDDVA